MKEPAQIITITTDQLRKIIREEVNDAIDRIDTAPEQILTFAQACKFLQVSRTALNDAGVPYQRIGAQRRYRLKELVAFGRSDRGARLVAKVKELRS